ncbi:MAG: hypothetical protein JO169_07830 [Solirubrobacterales bacterium]|nr:hypothetical protein [Solirubrobacterales bacterium]MBV9839004.1 hypothetical protein [Solirubrobacterales bacterium]
MATFQTSDPDTLRRGLEDLNRRAADGPPEGVPAVALLVLHKPDDGKVISITLFETEEDLRQGDAALSSMDPPRPGGLGQRVSVEAYEVAVKVEA